MTIREYEQAKAMAEEAARIRDKAAGAIEQLKSQLQEFGCKTIEEAERRANELKRLVTEKEKTTDKLYKEFQAQHAQFLEGIR